MYCNNGQDRKVPCATMHLHLSGMSGGGSRTDRTSNYPRNRHNFPLTGIVQGLMYWQYWKHGANRGSRIKLADSPCWFNELCVMQHKLLSKQLLVKKHSDSV